MTTVIAPEQAEELRRLYADLEYAHRLAADALVTNGEPLEGERLARFEAADQRVAAIVEAIQRIQAG